MIVSKVSCVGVGKTRRFSTKKNYRIADIPGDGIGKEVVPEAIKILKQFAPEIEIIRLQAGFETFLQTGSAVPSATLDSLKSCDGAIFGAVSSPTHKVAGYSSPIIAMRKAFGLYANLRPLISTPIEGSKPNVNILIVRENTECLYVKKERLEDDGNRAIADRVITRAASQKIAEMAFQQAIERSKSGFTNKPPMVTIVHKSNVLSVTDGLFRETCLEVSKKYPDVKAEEQIVDSMVYKLILKPEYYDVVVAPNLYGDILSDAGAALVGGLGVAPSANVGADFSLVEPVHGSAPDIAGKNVANPIATISALSLLLRTSKSLKQESKYQQLAKAIDQAVYTTLKEGPKTQDLHGQASTEQVGDYVRTQIKNLLK